MNHKKLKLCQVQLVDEKAMIRNLCNQIPFPSPVTITSICNNFYRNIDVSLGFKEVHQREKINRKKNTSKTYALLQKYCASLKLGVEGLTKGDNQLP